MIQSVVSSHANYQVSSIPGQTSKLAGHIRRPRTVNGQQGRPPTAGEGFPHVLDYGRAARDISGIIEDRITKKDNVPHRNLPLLG
jgi:hypothetical protein